MWKKIIIIILSVSFSSILLYNSQYFGIRLKYIFYKNYKIKEEEDEVVAEESESDNDDEIKRVIKYDKDKNKIKFRNEKLNTKNSDGVLLLTQSWYEQNKTYDLKKFKMKKQKFNE